MKIFYGFISFMLSASLQAQVNILISDETGNPFILGLDGFRQNEKPVKNLIIHKLDTSSHTLDIHLRGNENIHFRRAIKIPLAGNHQYVITKNFVGTVQLRYRGQTTQFPVEIMSVTPQRTQPWPDTLTLVALSREEKIESPPAEAVVVKKTEAEATSIPVSPSSRETIIKDTVAVRLADPFPAFISRLAAAEYEFIRLNNAKDFSTSHPLTVAQVREIFTLFQYDNTRLQFLRHAAEKISDRENIKELESSFEYELSREQFKKDHL